MRRSILLIGATALALSACSPPTTNGTPTPTSGGASPSPSSSSDQAPGPDAPKVTTPLNLTQVKRTPCNALTEKQAGELLGSGASSKESLDGAAGPSCMWSIPATSRPLVDVIFGRTPDGGTASVYKAKGGAYKLVEPLAPIDGHPLTAYGTKDERPSGKCSVALGASDTETIGIVAELSEANIGKKDPCDAAREAAIRVLTTIRGGN
ncbi:DUF3558 domain-containing protein [Amycolatopsis sp. BJA-103]|uniref:DUF3558 domain-containing protein n=1 Tax=Amycolatopsis sp. BJA-103 TaxID=1911175 RepID=UPI000C762934|nr:DUF3558 domain-containing protein [Amycolatopsis sp. BJA-103]AUI63178.1 hypothetical protein BKN51_36875 [Amycolatopsis sp. BJA-103]PNE19022.1 hypothetical protein B1H26_14580 [Amycolatopsis sp. BJA-103]